MSLRDIINAATPGPWEYVAVVGYESVYAHQHRPCWVVADARDNGPADARFIATFDPEMVGRLLDVLEAARAIDGDWCDGFNITEFGCTCPAHDLIARVRDALAAAEVQP